MVNDFGQPSIEDGRDWVHLGQEDLDEADVAAIGAAGRVHHPRSRPDHGPIIVAEKLGSFADQGLEVEVIAPRRSLRPADTGGGWSRRPCGQLSAQPAFACAEGLSLVCLRTLVAKPPHGLLVLKDGPMQETSQLNGGTIGFSVA